MVHWFMRTHLFSLLEKLPLVLVLYNLKVSNITPTFLQRRLIKKVAI